MSYQRRQVRAALARLGVAGLRDTGSHTIVRGPNGRQTSVPRHSELNRITVMKIAKQLGVEWQSLDEQIRGASCMLA